MPYLKLRCVATLIAALTVAASTALAQNGANSATKTSPKKNPSRAQALSVPSISPLRRPETPAHQAPNLYDKTSDEFNAFRDELGKTELSTKQKKRLADIAARTVYADPMDKPAADGSKFINIFDQDEIYSDGEEFVDPDDPDVKYAAEENNILAQADTICKNGTAYLSLYFGVSSEGQGSEGRGGPSAGPSYDAHPMPVVGGLDPSVAPGGGVSGGGPGVSGGGPGAAKPQEQVKESANDDSKMLFEGDNTENPFKDEAAADPEKDFDFFQADREFKPKPRDANRAGGPGVSGDVPELWDEGYVPINEK